VWTSDQRNRLALEHRLLQAEGFGQFTIYWNRESDDYYGSGIASSNSGRRYSFYLDIPYGFPEQRPLLYITDPRPLLMADGRWLSGIGVSHDMHTLTPSSNGCVQICHWRDDRWHAGIHLHRVFLKSLIWLEAYEQHLLTGRPLAQFVSTMVGAQ
jgi:hypothetical protein